MTLDKLEIGKKAVIRCVNYEEKALYKHILDMGLTPGTEITLVKRRPWETRLNFRSGDILLLYGKRTRQTSRLRGSTPLRHHTEIEKIYRTVRLERCTGHEYLVLLYRKGLSLVLPLWEIRTAARPHFSTSSPAQTSVWEIFRVLPWTERTVQ